MSPAGVDPFIGEIRMFSGIHTPTGWQLCDGTLLQITDYTVLYALIGTTYGGDGKTTFGVPDLRGRFPIHHSHEWGNGTPVGAETVVLQTRQLPPHTHRPMQALDSPGTLPDPSGNMLARSHTGNVFLYAKSSPITAMAENSIGYSGWGYGHHNIQPFLCINFIIALDGIYPPRNAEDKPPAKRAAKRPAKRAAKRPSKRAAKRPARRAAARKGKSGG
jgi:microcystin-dependent protein